MLVNQLIQEVKQHPNAAGIGMILSHTGIVRGTSRDGRKVSGLKVAVDQERLRHVCEKEKQSPGIVDIRVAIIEDQYLFVGDEIMGLVVAGDVRDHVIPVLERTLTAIKETVTRKTEDYV